MINRNLLVLVCRSGVGMCCFDDVVRPRCTINGCSLSSYSPPSPLMQNNSAQCQVSLLARASDSWLTVAVVLSQKFPEWVQVCSLVILRLLAHLPRPPHPSRSSLCIQSGSFGRLSVSVLSSRLVAGGTVARRCGTSVRPKKTQLRATNY